MRNSVGILSAKYGPGAPHFEKLLEGFKPEENVPMKTMDQAPLLGNSISPTLRNVVPDCENKVSKICLRLL